jgi:beta-phosphoglucomutase
VTSYGVIFDMDGVLVDSTEAHYQAWNAIGQEIGHPYPKDIFLKTFGMHNRQSMPIWLGRDASESEMAWIADRKEALYRKNARATLQPIPGVVPLIKALAADGFKLAVGSSGPAANVAMALAVLGVQAFFSALSTGDEVKEGKPHPAIFLNAAKKLNLEPSHCAVIEDAPQGVEAAKRAGMVAIAIPTSRPKTDLLAADWVADSLREVTPEGILKRLQAAIARTG